MPKRQYKPPEHLIKKWPEVFEDLHMDTIPVAYMNLVRLVFQDGRIWEVDIASQLRSNHPQAVAETLISILDEYQEEIVDIDFDFDIDKLKEDIQTETKNLF